MATGKGWPQARDGHRQGMATGKGWPQARDGHRQGMATGKGWPQARDGHRQKMGEYVSTQTLVRQSLMLNTSCSIVS